MPAPTRTYIKRGEREAVAEARRLVLASRWFEVTPLPDEEFEFVVKRDG